MGVAESLANRGSCKGFDKASRIRILRASKRASGPFHLFGIRPPRRDSDIAELRSGIEEEGGHVQETIREIQD